MTAQTLDLIVVRLDLFDGEGGGAAGGATASIGSSGDTTATVRYGKQDGETIRTDAQGKPSDAGSGSHSSGVQTTSDTLEEKRKTWQAMISGDYKDLYTEDTQRIIDRRFKETKALQEQVDRTKPVIDMLMERYGIQDGDIKKLENSLDNDAAYWIEAADEAGMTVDQYREMQRLKRENASLLKEQERAAEDAHVQNKLQQWAMEAEALKQVYPGFDLNAEAENPQFVALLRSGVPVEHAYKVIHMDEIVGDAVRTTAATTEKNVVANVRAKGARPRENGVAGQSAFTVKDDVSKLSKADRAEIARRVARGEKISF